MVPRRALYLVLLRLRLARMFSWVVVPLAPPLPDKKHVHANAFSAPNLRHLHPGQSCPQGPKTEITQGLSAQNSHLLHSSASCRHFGRALGMAKRSAKPLKPRDIQGLKYAERSLPKKNRHVLFCPCPSFLPPSLVLGLPPATIVSGLPGANVLARAEHSR